MRLSSTLSSCILKTSSDGDSTMSLGRLFQWLIVLTVKNFFYRDETSSGATCTCCPLSAPCGSLRREGLHPLYSCPLSTAIPWWGPPWAFSSPGRKDLTPSVFPHIAGSPALWSSSWPAFGPSPVCLHFWIVGTRAGHGTPGAARWALSGTLVSPSLLVMSPQMQPRIRFAFVAAAAHCWLVFSLSTRTPRSLSARLLPSHTDPSLYWGLWLWCPSCRTWHLSLLNFIQFLLAHFSRLSRSLFLTCPPHHQFSVISKLGAGAFSPIVQIIYEEAEQRGTRYWCLGDLTCDRLPAWVKTIDHHPLSMACEPVSYPSRRPSIQSVSCQFGQEKAVGNSIDHVAKSR